MDFSESFAIRVQEFCDKNLPGYVQREVINTRNAFKFRQNAVEHGVHVYLDFEPLATPSSEKFSIKVNWPSVNDKVMRAFDMSILINDAIRFAGQLTIFMYNEFGIR